jgi:site-specific DNA recombinase
MKALGYIRVSTEEQAREGVSLAAQEERVRAYASAKGWELVDIRRDDGHSAKDLRRPAIQLILSRLRAREFDVLIICKLDRLTRSVKDLGQLLDAFQKAKVALSAIDESLDTSTAAGKLLVNILGSVAQWEREANGERTRAALHHKRARLQAYSPTPYGFRRQGAQLLEQPAEQRAIGLMHELRSQGLSLRGICTRLQQKGISTRSGKPWHPYIVSRILANPLHKQWQKTG